MTCTHSPKRNREVGNVDAAQTSTSEQKPPFNIQEVVVVTQYTKKSTTTSTQSQPPSNSIGRSCTAQFSVFNNSRKHTAAAMLDDDDSARKSNLNPEHHYVDTRAEQSLMKDTAYRAKCIDKVLSKHNSLDVMLDLADIANDIFQISLKNENKKLTTRRMRQIIKELNKWNQATLKT